MATKRLDLSLQPLNHFLILTKGPFELKSTIEVTNPPNQNPQKKGTEDDQEERNFCHLKPLDILDGIANADLIFVLY
jgi:hypothetical protein